MNQWDAIRELARQRYAQARALAKEDSAAALLAAAAQLTGIRCRALRANDRLLDGSEAMLDPDAETIWFNGEIKPEVAAFYQAHEYGHSWIDGAYAACGPADLDGEATEERIPLGVHHIEGYSPKERRECQANIFAREFLLPAPVLRRWFVEDGLDGSAVAARVGVPEGIVFHQLTYALLTPLAPEPSDASLAPEPAAQLQPLDPSQEKAAHAPGGPLLIDAGPGTGKTKTLVGRVTFLLQELHVEPSSILALTFSNKAAEEMRERVARVVPSAAPHIWMGTFHSFGLELLRRHGSRLGLPLRPEVLDPADALVLLENFLPELRLDHYQNLYEPAISLHDILQAISRAKDEMVTPARYLELAQLMRAQATTADAVKAAEKALEAAGVYGFYQEQLDQKQLLDFGDLIFKSVVLLQTHVDVRDEIRRTYRHTLVDEYQDVNRASAVLLRGIAGAGQGLWVVGDMRQSIYRFRGASPSNVRLFGDDFPGARVFTLERNYRSQPKIVDTFAELVPHLQAAQGEKFTPWQKHRADAGGQVLMEIADDPVAEGKGLAREIRRRHAAGIPYHDQAVLCRSHTALARFAAILEQSGVPILYFGDLFERPEVRDLLALLSLACDGDGRGLVRVGGFREYDIPLADTLHLLDLARAQNVPFPRALALARDAEGISGRGKSGLALLASHLDGISYGTNSWGLLVHYIFGRSVYLRDLLRDTTVPGQQQRLALYQFLQFAHERRSAPVVAGADPKRAFLQYVRRLEVFGDERQLRQMPECATRMDAVRLLTVHASKGLEFRAVYLPGLARGSFPARRQHQPCPPPTGMLLDDMGNGHEEEEECLFFVALSRARDHLCLSRPSRSGGKTSNPSDLLTWLTPVLPRRAEGAVTWPADGSATTEDASIPVGPAELRVFDVDELDQYLKCPRQYFYERVLGLGGQREDSAYVQFHRCVYAVLYWLQEEMATGRAVDDAAVQARLAEQWASHGPVDHPFAAIYLRNAQEMVARLLNRHASRARPAPRPVWEVSLSNAAVRLQPDHVQILDDGTELVQRLRTGRISAGEKDKDINALYQIAARQQPGRSRQVQIASLTEDLVQPINLSANVINTRVRHYEAAVAGILRECFHPAADCRDCPRCPHYFICPEPTNL